MTGPVVLYDGVCNLCNAAVRFVAANDPDGNVRFLPLQSPQAAERLREGEAVAPEDGTFVLLAHGRRYVRSDAALYLALSLRAPWPIAFAAILIPRDLRDAVYRWVARNRYRWFGRQLECAVPPPALRERFLDAGERALPR